MVKPTRSNVLSAAAVAGLLLALWLSRGERVAVPTSASDGGKNEPLESPLPRIALDRLDKQKPQEEPEGARDIFSFGAPRTVVGDEHPAPPLASVTTPPPVAMASGPPPPSTMPAFHVKYIGTLETKGVKVAILMTADKNEVLIGREGETVANRLKIVRIGFESVDVQDVGSTAPPRRIALRAN